jgi:hypothetical protein
MRHKIIFASVALLVLFLIAVYPLADLMSQNHRADTPDLATKESILEAYGKLPILFIQNQGQMDSTVQYYTKAPQQTLYLTPGSIVFDLSRCNNADTVGPADRQAERLVFSLDFLGANSQPAMEGSSKDRAVVNYFIGNDPEKWHSNIPTYRELVYKDIYPSIDLRLYGKGSVLEYEFVVKPGASPDEIALVYNGVDKLALEEDVLVISTAFGPIKQTKPYIYQQIGGEVMEVGGGFRLAGGNSYGFYVAAYDTSHPLIIDPTLSYSTYLGGSDDDYGYGIAVDTSGCAYVTGRTYSSNFPTQGPYQGTNAGSWDAFVTKLSAAGNSLAYSTYLGGSGDDYGYGIAVDASGCAYVTGGTSSGDFSTQDPYQGTNAGVVDAFVTKLSAAGNSLIYSTYLGGSDIDEGHGIAVDTSGCAYVTGETSSGDFPTQDPYQGTNAGSWDAFVTKLSAAGNSLAYSTYLGGSDDDYGYGIAVDASGCAYVTGQTYSSNFPTQAPFQGTNAGSWDAFVAKLAFTVFIPTVTTQPASGIGTNSATLNMSYTLGDYGLVDVRFAYKKSADPGWTYTSWTSKAADGSHAEPRTGLDSNTQYDFKAQLKYNSTVIEGDTLQFTTGKTPPTVTTEDATGIGTDSATLNMSYTLGDYGPVNVRFAYKKSAGSTWTYTTWVSKAASGAYAKPLTGLDSSTTYRFNAQLKYDTAVIEGDILQFTTGVLPPPPPPPPGPWVSPSLPAPHLPPADIRLQNLSVSPGQAQAGQPVTVLANVVNNGASSGSYNVALRINGKVEQQRTVEVSPGAAYPVKFTVTKSQPGTYDVAIDNQRASFTVLGGETTSRAPVSDGLIALIAMAVLILATVVVLMITFRRPA